MKQKSINKTKQKEDDGLPQVSKKLEQLSADHMIVEKSSSGKHENSVAFTIRDVWSGCGIAQARPSRSLDHNRVDLKHFVGRVSGSSPEILVKSDAAKEITGAVTQLGWHPEPCLANKWPHNASHERWIQTLKSVIRASMLQSGFPEQISEWSAPYSSISLALKQPCTIHEWEKDASGITLEAFRYKENWTAWMAFHEGEEFVGKRPLFGQLIYYLDKKANSLMPPTSPGLFVGWRLDSGLRYRGVLLVADYSLIRQGILEKLSIW